MVSFGFHGNLLELALLEGPLNKRIASARKFKKACNEV
jgi:hypothetical protein